MATMSRGDRSLSDVRTLGEHELLDADPVLPGFGFRLGEIFD